MDNKYLFSGKKIKNGKKKESYVSCALCRRGMLVKERNGEAHNFLYD